MDRSDKGNEREAGGERRREILRKSRFGGDDEVNSGGEACSLVGGSQARDESACRSEVYERHFEIHTLHEFLVILSLGIGIACIFTLYSTC